MLTATTHIAQRAAQLARHPLFEGLRSPARSPQERLAFAPILSTFVMGFSDLNKWFLRYPDPRDEFERAINQHTFEDQTHSRLFLQDWRRLGFDERLAWRAGQTLAWYYCSPLTEAFRDFGMELAQMCVVHADAPTRYSYMEAVESCGLVFFSATAPVAVELARETGIEYRYFGPHHLARETGRLQADTSAFATLRLDAAQRRTAVQLIDRVFDLFVSECDHMLAYAFGAVGSDAGSIPPPAPAALADRPDILGTAAAGRPPEAPRGVAADRPAKQLAEDLAERLDRRRRATAAHPLFDWLRQDRSVPSPEKLRRLALLWAPDVLGYRDLARYALSYRHPADARQRAINHWMRQLQSHHRLFLQDWAALRMDEWLGWTASQTLHFYCLSRHTELQRRNMAGFVQLAFAGPDPLSRCWLIQALEATGEPFFAATRELTAALEREQHLTLDYLGDRHELAHPEQTLPPSDTFEWRTAPLTPQQAAFAQAAIDRVFDSIHGQYTHSLQSLSSSTWNDDMDIHHDAVESRRNALSEPAPS